MQSLIEESIKIHGIDAVYIPRKNEKVDLQLHEDVLANFEDYHFIELYIKNVDSFDGDQDIFKKFGLEIKNQITFSISRSSFAKLIGKELPRPKEGDLIYLPMSTASALYEIKFVKEDSIFFSLGEFYMYDLQCEVFTPSGEDIETGIQEIDSLGNESEPTISLELGIGSGIFEVGETVYQGDSILGADAKATIVEIINNSTLKVKNVFGSFSAENGALKGKNAQYALKQNSEKIAADFYAQNSEYDQNSVIDFTEYNPFSEEDY